MKCAKVEVYCGKSNSLLELYFPEMGVCASKKLLCGVGQLKSRWIFENTFFWEITFAPKIVYSRFIYLMLHSPNR